MKVRKRTEFGQYIVADPEICHGQLTFTGNRIMVKSVLEMLARGKDWDWISMAYDNRVSREAIAEAVSLASDALFEKMGERLYSTAGQASSGTRTQELIGKSI